MATPPAPPTAAPMKTPSPLTDEARRAAPPEAWEPMLRLARFASRPLERFLRIQASSGIVLIVAAAVAIAWANSRWAPSYERLWHTTVGVRLGGFVFERSLEWFVNDVLMTIFFFVVGMEIRREMHHGELSEWRRAVLPAAAAFGGMAAPALLYLALSGGGVAEDGWGVPMATDIAFALGVMALLGKRVPAALRVLLLALAVIDDLGAIVVIAVFYSSGIKLAGLGVAAAGVALLFALRAIGVRRPSGYVLPAAVIWAGTYLAGVHPTIAGVLVGLLTPVRAWLGAEGFVDEVRHQLHHVSEHMEDVRSSAHEMGASLKKVDDARREAISPAEYLIEAMHPWVAYAIMPIFALANAGVHVEGGALGGPTARVSFAVAVGLALGKPLGVVLASVLALKVRLAVLPAGLAHRHLVVLGVVAGIGFTMSLFVAQLAFDEPTYLAAAKLGVLVASTIAAVLGVAAGWLVLTPVRAGGGVAATADEAESSTRA